MRQRIRAVLSKEIAEDGEPVKAWLQYDPAVEQTIRQCRLSFAKQLNLQQPDSLELYVDGFKVLDTLSSDTLDPANDVVDIRRARSSSKRSSKATSAGTQHAKRRKIGGSEDTSAGRQAVSQEVAASPILQFPQILPPLLKAGKVRKAGSKQSSSHAGINLSDAASTSSGQISTSASGSSSSSRSSSSTSSSSSSSGSSSSSSSSSSSASTSSASSSSLSDDDDDGPPRLQSSRALVSTKSQQVPPGQGKAATRARNLRKRQRQQLLKMAKQDLLKATGLERPKVTAIKEAAHKSDASPPASRLEPVSAPAETISAQKGLVNGHASERSSPEDVQVIHSKGTSPIQRGGSSSGDQNATGTSIPKTSTPAPLSTSTKEDLRMLSLAAGNSKKAKSLRRDLISGRRQQSTKILYDDQGDGSSRSAGLSSLDLTSGIIVPVKTPADTRQPATPEKPTTLQKSFVKASPAKIARPQPPPPSTRCDLPANVTVTSVDVEAADFVPGESTSNFVAPLQLPNMQSAPSSATRDSASYFDAYSGYYGNGLPLPQKPGKGTSKLSKKKQMEQKVAVTKDADPACQAANLDANGWAGWPNVSDLEGGMFDSLAPITAPGDGEMVAVKVLELSPSDFMPALSLYYGLVLSLESTPHSSSIKLKLHPACRSASEAEETEAEADANGAAFDDADLSPQLPRYFGEDLDMEDSEGPFDIKIIKLDDIVDCRKLALTA